MVVLVTWNAPSGAVLLLGLRSRASTVYRVGVVPLAGDCQDTLGKCVCIRDKGSNEMKSILNHLVDMNRSLSEIDAAMISRYGAQVMVDHPQPAAVWHGLPGVDNQV